MELFQPVVEQTDWHFNFSALMIPGFADGERALLQEWAHGFEDREGKFVREFQTTFNSSFWELYLFAVFKQFGFTCDFSVAAPDFVVSGPNAPFVAEAVIAGHPDGYKPEWERTVDDAQSFDRELVLQLATTRIANAIWTKYQKYLNSYSKLPHVAGRPYVICVAPFEQPLFFVQNDNALRRVLYGIDQPLWVDSETGRIPVGQALSSTVTKDNGSVIDIGFFCSDRMSEVSAVIFSNTATFTKLRALSPAGAFPVMIQAIRFNASGTEPRHVVAPRPEYQETLVDGLHVCLNPYASRPLDVSAFCNGDACIHSFDLVSREYIVHTPDGFLFQHGAIALPEAGMFEFPEQTNADASYRLPA